MNTALGAGNAAGAAPAAEPAGGRAGRRIAVGVITGADLRRVRRDKGWGLDKLAPRVGYSKSHLSRLERGLAGRVVSADLVHRYEIELRVTITPQATALDSGMGARQSRGARRRSRQSVAAPPALVPARTGPQPQPPTTATAPVGP
jgi:transcriptional regulator with XRE-family HTH domain